jgi:nucleotide-binding universal stress UspA family protein
MWKRILVPHDFSASAAHAVEIAVYEARAHGAAIVLLHVVELMPTFGRDTTMMVRPGTTQQMSVTSYHIETAEAELAPIAAGLQGAGIEVMVDVRVGVPVEEIQRCAAERAVDAIVMGTHGRTGLGRMLAGSVAERVVRTSSVPVLTVRHPDHT